MMLIDLQLSKWVGFSFVLTQKVTLNDTTISKVLLFFASYFFVYFSTLYYIFRYLLVQFQFVSKICLKYFKVSVKWGILKRTFSTTYKSSFIKKLV